MMNSVVECVTDDAIFVGLHIFFYSFKFVSLFFLLFFCFMKTMVKKLQWNGMVSEYFSQLSMNFNFVGINSRMLKYLPNSSKKND